MSTGGEMTTTPAPAFTGRHLLWIFIGFFAVVVGVNILMARLAIGTFGGTVVANSYVASQHYNDWLTEGRRQKALGWQVRVERLAGGQVQVVATDRGGHLLTGLTASARAERPLGQGEPLRLAFDDRGEGLFSRSRLPGGRWRLHLALNRGGQQFQTVQDLP
jgi:nitrogen fixation protein FixH